MRNQLFLFPPIICPLRIPFPLTLSKTGHKPASIFKSIHWNIGQATMLRYKTVSRVCAQEKFPVSSSAFSIPWLCSLWDTQLGLQSNEVYPHTYTGNKGHAIVCRDINANFRVSWGEYGRIRQFFKMYIHNVCSNNYASEWTKDILINAHRVELKGASLQYFYSIKNKWKKKKTRTNPLMVDWLNQSWYIDIRSEKNC